MVGCYLPNHKKMVPINCIETTLCSILTLTYSCFLIDLSECILIYCFHLVFLYISQLKDMLEQNAAYSSELEKLSRDKVALIGELDETKLQLKRFDKETSIVGFIIFCTIFWSYLRFYLI